MTRGATVDGRVLLLPSHMRGHPLPTDVLDAVLSVLAAVGSQRARAVSPCPQPVQELRNRLPLGRAGGLADREVHQQPVAVFHQGMAHEGQPGFLARTLAQQVRLGIRGAGVRLVAPALPSEVHRRVARIVVPGRRCRFVLGPEVSGRAGAW